MRVVGIVGIDGSGGDKNLYRRTQRQEMHAISPVGDMLEAAGVPACADLHYVSGTITRRQASASTQMTRVRWLKLLSALPVAAAAVACADRSALSSLYAQILHAALHQR